jgi:hypothetical protein
LNSSSAWQHERRADRDFLTRTRHEHGPAVIRVMIDSGAVTPAGPRTPWRAAAAAAHPVGGHGPTHWRHRLAGPWAAGQPEAARPGAGRAGDRAPGGHTEISFELEFKI